MKNFKIYSSAKKVLSKKILLTAIIGAAMTVEAVKIVPHAYAALKDNTVVTEEMIEESQTGFIGDYSKEEIFVIEAPNPDTFETIRIYTVMDAENDNVSTIQKSFMDSLDKDKASTINTTVYKSILRDDVTCTFIQYYNDEANKTFIEINYGNNNFVVTTITNEFADSTMTKETKYYKNNTVVKSDDSLNYQITRLKEYLGSQKSY